MMRATTNMFNFKGVTWESSRAKFMPQIKNPDTGKRRTYGRFDTAEAAARKYDELAREFYGEGAVLNFPIAGEKKVIVGKPSDYPWPRDIDCCPAGHQYAVYGRKTDRGIACRACNLQSVKKYQARKRAS